MALGVYIAYRERNGIRINKHVVIGASFLLIALILAIWAWVAFHDHEDSEYWHIGPMVAIDFISLFCRALGSNYTAISILMIIRKHNRAILS